MKPEPQGEPAWEPAPVSVPRAIERCLSKEDRLEAENVQLRIQLQAKRVQETERLLGDLQQGLAALLDARKLIQAALAEKYSIDFTHEQIEPVTGRIIPVPGLAGDG